jgi:DNA-binding NtrC family response regulator
MLKAFANRGIHAMVVGNVEAAYKQLASNTWSLVIVGDCLCDRRLSARDLLNSIKADNPELCVIMTSDDNSSRIAVEAMRTNFDDFIAKPVDMDQFYAMIDLYLPAHDANVLYGQADKLDGLNIIGQSAALYEIIELAQRVAKTSAPVLIAGQSGTGKELISALIHDSSERRDGPYIRVNCASLSDTLLESDLFGHEKGAFTGACTSRKGRFERAHGGTLLLDEITETTPGFQAHLLRVLENQDFERVGSDKSIKVNVRVISTTNRDIIEEVSKGNFRADLYYRLAGIRLVVPPLCERAADIEQLVWHFVNQLGPEARRNITKLDDTMMSVFENYTWPGNVRQLRNVVRTCLILGQGEILTLANVSWLLEELSAVCNGQPSIFSEMIGSTSLAEIEQHAIIETLKNTEGNQLKAAKVLGISDRTIREKVKQYRSRGVMASIR